MDCPTWYIETEDEALREMLERRQIEGFGLAKRFELGLFDPEDRTPAYCRQISTVVADATITRRAMWSTSFDDMCDPQLIALWLRVKPREGATRAQIAGAIHVEFSSHGGCGHEHDCCGCRSYFCSGGTKLDDADEDGCETWLAEITSARNY